MLVEILVLLAAIAGTAGLLGAFGWLWYRVRALEETLGGRGRSVLAFGGQRGGEHGQEPEIPEVRRELARLAERVDFLERLLERDRAGRPESGILPEGGGLPEDGGLPEGGGPSRP